MNPGKKALMTIERGQMARLRVAAEQPKGSRERIHIAQEYNAVIETLEDLRVKTALGRIDLHTLKPLNPEQFDHARFYRREEG